MEDEQEAKKFAEAIASVASRLGGRDLRKKTIEILLNEHRTIQQNTMRFFMEFVEAMANQSYDGRNEASVKLSKQIIDKCPNRALPFI